MEALARDAALLIEEKKAEFAIGHGAIRREIATLKAKEKKLLAAYLDGTVASDVYREHADELATARRALELRIAEAGREELATIEQVRALASQASCARIRFQDSGEEGQREVLQTLLCNLDVEGGRIASYQYKDPFGVLVMDSSGAFEDSWWAIVDGLVARSNGPAVRQASLASESATAIRLWTTVDSESLLTRYS